LRDFDAAKLTLASGTYEIVGLPRIQVETLSREQAARSDTAKRAPE